MERESAEEKNKYIYQILISSGVQSYKTEKQKVKLLLDQMK